MRNGDISRQGAEQRHPIPRRNAQRLHPLGIGWNGRLADRNRERPTSHVASPWPKIAVCLPPGQWPGGTGESPVPPRQEKSCLIVPNRDIFVNPPPQHCSFLPCNTGESIVFGKTLTGLTGLTGFPKAITTAGSCKPYPVNPVNPVQSPLWLRLAALGVLSHFAAIHSAQSFAEATGSPIVPGRAKTRFRPASATHPIWLMRSSPQPAARRRNWPATTFPNTG